MLDRILPRRLDNDYRGRRLALWLFAPVIVMKTGIALTTIFNGQQAAQSADGLPLASFGAAGAEAVVTLFALWGVAQLVIIAIGVLALVRYRAMIPLMFVLLLLEWIGRKAVLLAMPIARTGAGPGQYVNLALLALMIVGLALSLWRRADATAQA
jgi:hypothetical protein